MEESRGRRRGGGAAVSKKPAAGGSAYADVFGGPPRFASRLDDYAEIFGDLAGSCSIPFLDLPPAADVCDAAPVRARGAGFDYSEVFGGLDFGEFAAPYDELFAAPGREEARSSNGRTTEEATCSQQAVEEFKFSPRHSHGGCIARQQLDIFSSNSNPSDNGSTQLNMSYSETSHGSKEGTMSGETHTTQLHAVPQFSFVVDTDTSFQTIGCDGPNVLNDGIDNEKHLKKCPATTSWENAKSSENYSIADQKHSTNKYPVSENGQANASHHSRSSSSSMSNGDVSSSDIMYLTVSDFSLRTKPLRVPPPSRPPPRLFDKQGHPKPRISSSPKTGLQEVSLSKPVSNEEDFHVHQEVVKDNSPSFFDVEVDVSSAAAASAAAIKEAMALAQAKLKSAKGLLEKKRDNLQKSKMLDHHGSIKHKEQKLGQALIGQEIFEEMLVASDKRNKFTSAAKLTPQYKEKDKVVVLTEENEQTRQVSDLKSSKPFSKSADKSEKWKTNKEYHELVNSEKYKMTEEVSEREGLMKKTKVMTMVCEVKQNESTKDALTCEIDSDRNLRKDDVDLVACVHEENASLESHNSHAEEVEKPGEVHKLHGQEEVIKTPYSGEALSFAGIQQKMEPSDNCKLHYAHDDSGEKSKLEASVEACEGENSFKFVEINESKEEKGKSEAAKPQGKKDEKEINFANVAPEPSKGEEKLNVASATDAQEETEIQMPRGSCISKGEGMEGACKCTDSERRRREENQCNVKNVNQLEGTMAVHDQEKREELHMKQQSCLSAENELRLTVDQEANKLEVDLKKWKSTVGATTCEEEEKLMKATKTAFWQDCNENKAKEAQAELQRDKKEDATPESYNQENFEGQKIYERDLQVCGNEGIIEIQVEPHFIDKIMSMNAVPVICKRPLKMTMDVQPANLSDKGGNVPYLPLVAMESQPVASQKIISDIKITEEKEKERMEWESEQMEKQTRKLEEEKENERIQEEEKEKTKLLEEAKEMKRKLEEEKETSRLLEEAKDGEKNLEEESERARLLEEAKERERKLKEEKERARLLEEAKERERKLEEEKEHARLLEEAKERERKLQEEKDRAKLLEEAKERERKVEEEKERARLLEVKERERKLEEEKERARLLEEEKEREREREKDRLAVERATREAHERAFAEARERAERIAVERVTSEAWQRTLKEAREKAEKVSSDAVEKSLTEKSSREARLRAERAAVERATAEARERAVERALAEKAAADARERAERYNATSRDRTRKENVTEEHLKGRDKDGLHDAQFRSIGSSSSYQPNSDSNDQREGESPLRCKARLERHQRIAERAAKALAEKNTRDILAQREQAERNRLAEYLDADVKRWSNGKEGNLRALLSTLQYILGPESGWQPIPLTDVITASAVKKAYRKATLCVHPDKLQQRGASIQQKYICEKVFDLLKEAWNKFNSEER